ncbi:hypothetical protein FNH22_12090 [Fulvivirga sp. M361]|uniref:DUF6155 family protein n=1 Tax=Fulvivirga sp. M361 TaxID=2594266 RepID=UPI00117A9C68|nr:DUF6155 family protein [Fulvivirga sp. M361]TRX58615.1 hypothetical protein FNH22_12090 [Fulvivirga sp. M361]
MLSQAKLMTMDPVELHKILDQKNKEELLEEIIALYKKFKVVREFYGLSNKKKKEHVEIIEGYKHKITNALWPDGNFEGGLDLEKVNRLLKQFSSVCDNTKDQIELELYSLYQANSCAICFGGDFGEEYYEYVEERFDQTLNKMIRSRSFENQKRNVQAIIKNAFEGYGHKDRLEELMAKYESAKHVQNENTTRTDR